MPRNNTSAVGVSVYSDLVLGGKLRGHQEDKTSGGKPRGLLEDETDEKSERAAAATQRRTSRGHVTGRNPKFEKQWPRFITFRPPCSFIRYRYRRRARRSAVVGSEACWLMKCTFLTLFPCLWLWPTFACAHCLCSDLLELGSLPYNNANQVSNSGQAINGLLSFVCICEITVDLRFWLRVWLAHHCGFLVEIYCFHDSRESSCRIGFIASCQLLRRNRSRLHIKVTCASQTWLATFLLILNLRIWR